MKLSAKMLSEMTDAEFKSAIELVMTEQKERRRQRQATVAATLKKGDKVSFMARGRGRNSKEYEVKGIVEKVNRTSARVTEIGTNKGNPWRVGLGSLTKI